MHGIKGVRLVLAERLSGWDITLRPEDPKLDFQIWGGGKNFSFYLACFGKHLELYAQGQL